MCAILQNATMRIIYLFLILLTACRSKEAHAEAMNTISIERGLGLGLGDNACNFKGEILVSHPMSVDVSNRFFSTGQLQLKAMEMLVDYLNKSGNTESCGIEVGGENYSVKLQTLGDESDKGKVEEISMFTQNSTKFFVGPYSSGLTGVQAPIVQDIGNLLIAGGAASTSVFKDRDNIFGTFPPTSNYMAEAIRGLSIAGAKSVATIYEDASFTSGVCAAVANYANEFDLTLTSETMVVASPTQANLTSVAQQMIDEDPDVVVTCVYDAGCVEWMNTMRAVNWSPKAQVFTVCVGQTSFVDAVGDDREYIMGVSPWDPSLPIQDTLTGWSASEFAEIFYRYSARSATYHAASAFASMAILLQSIRDTNSFDVQNIQASISTNTFRTLYGDISFDGNGQSLAPSLVLQYNGEGIVNTVFPDEKRSNPAEGIVYPMPSWSNRDCAKALACESSGGSCQQDGSCLCGSSQELSIGNGETAVCVVVPVEDYSYMNEAYIICGYVFVGLQFIMSLGSVFWIHLNRDHELVKASQPEFLHVISFGCFLIVLSIIPMTIEGDYRVAIDPDTFEFTEEKDSNIDRVDAACMGFIWLYNVGFIIVFSALFAKINRIKKIFFRKSIQRTTVKARQVAVIIFILTLIMIILMTLFQLIAPLEWERDVTQYDFNGFRLTSSGSCKLQKNSDIFLIILALFHLGCLSYALFLCFQLRSVPAEFVEAKWIFVSIFCFVQVLVTAIPIMFIVVSNPEASFFVRSGVACVEGFIVTCLIFGPKVYAVYSKPEKGQVAGALREYQSRAQSRNSQTPSRAQSRNSQTPGNNEYKSSDSHIRNENSWSRSRADDSIIVSTQDPLPVHEESAESY